MASRTTSSSSCTAERATRNRDVPGATVGEPDRLIGTVGVDNLLIVQDGDAILVADRRDEASIKQLVEMLKAKGLEKYQ